MHRVKEKIAALAKNDKWSLEQLQYAEDYIDALFEGRTQAHIPPRLNSTYAEAIRKVFFTTEPAQFGRPSS